MHVERHVPHQQRHVQHEQQPAEAVHALGGRELQLVVKRRAILGRDLHASQRLRDARPKAGSESRAGAHAAVSMHNYAREAANCCLFTHSETSRIEINGQADPVSPPRRTAPQPSSAAPAGTQSWRLQPPSIFSYLDAVAHHGSIRKAAEALHIASSALNRRILDLEEDVGSPLFERLPRGVRATAAGELFLAYVRRSLKELRMVEAQIDGLRGLVHGRVRIAVAESVTGRMLPERHRRVSPAAPGRRFLGDGRRPERAVASFGARQSRSHSHPREDGRSRSAGVGGGTAAVVRAGRARASARNQEVVTASRMCRVPVGDSGRNVGRALADRRRSGGASIRFEPALLSNSIETTKMFARTSGGVCFSFKIGKKPDISGMIAIPLSDPGLSDARLCLAGRRGRVLPVAAASFAEQLTTLFEEL